MSGEILDIEQMARADAFAVAAGTPSLTLMENAGRAVTAVIVARFPPCPAVVLCGPGNNGGDGFVVARLLAEQGFAVRVAMLGEPQGDAAVKARDWRGERIVLAPDVLEGAQLIVDALFGAGLSRPLDGAARDMVMAVNRSDAAIVAIDLPSGVAGDSGKILAPGGPQDIVTGVAIRAALTVTFFRKKPAHLLLPGRDLCGEIIVADIGIPREALAGIALFENGADRWSYPWPRPGAHKYDRGHCLVISGPMHATGAARLAARAALRVGAGLVSVASPPDAVAVHAAHLTAIMIKPFEGARGLSDLLSDRRLNAAVIGPGVGVGGETRELVSTVLAGTASIVLDADALTSFRDDPDALFARIRSPAVLTPHEGEFERLFPGLLAQAPSRVEATRIAAGRAGCVVLLKGSDTVIAAPDGFAVINSNAPPSLGTAGSGDVLSGIIGGLLAMGMDAFAAACAGAWLHGDAAGRFGPGLIAEDIPELLPEVLAALQR
jgi:NAD(P)H-hydrate epimerase